MENYNALSVTLSAENIERVRLSFKAINEIMPFLTGLTAAKKKSMPTMNVANKIFAEDCYRIMLANPQYSLNESEVTELRKDLDIFDQLDEIQKINDELGDKINSTRLVAGMEAFRVARKLYARLQEAVKDGVPGAKALLDHLKPRFQQQGVAKRSPKKGN